MKLTNILRRLGLVAALLSATSGFAQTRTSQLLNADWNFQSGEVNGAETAGFDATGWQTLSLPHNWGWEQAQRGENYLRGPGWYRRVLDLGTPKPGRRYFVRFEAAGSVADVFVNGTSLGQHRGAFGAFCFELTKHLAPDGTNVLAVRVSNAPESDIAPLSGDFCVFGGLYRSVHLLETDEVCITPTDHGSPGVAWLQTKVSAWEAALDVTVQISNDTRRKQSRTLVARVVNASGKVVAESTQAITVMPNATEPYALRVVVPKPRLWHGRQDPYLYRAIVELREGETVRDAVEQSLGLRSFSVDPDKGFFLNGKPYHLHGVNRHQDRWNKGWAITEADQDEDLAMLKEIGATVIRCAHYQHSDYFYRLCDQAGILVWAEIPQVDRVGDSAKFAETSRNQLLDLIRQNVNHPSIFAWSLFNELRPGAKNPDPHRLLLDLHQTAKAEDPTRPTIAATCTEGLPQMNKIPDLLGWNVYYGWYADWGPLSDYDPMRAKYRYTSRHGGYCVSEYGGGATVTMHEQNPRKPKNDGQWHPEEYQNVLHEKAWAELKQAPYIWGTFVWVMFDFTSFWRNEGGTKGRNNKGLVTYDRAVKKDSFYFYKANWSEEPTLYITSRRHTERTNAVTDVKIYSNAKNVELRVNGVSHGSRKNDGNAVFVWPQVTLKPGGNAIEATARHSGKTLQDRCEWQLLP
jgi:beta-galactosidase